MRELVGGIPLILSSTLLIILMGGCLANNQDIQQLALLDETAAATPIVPEPTSTADTATKEHTEVKAARSTDLPTQTPQPAPLLPTPKPTSTLVPSPTPSPTESVVPSPTRAGRCIERVPSDDLLTLVTADYAISSAYVPGDLVDLADYLPIKVTLGYKTELRQIAAQPLVDLIEAMWEAGLSPQILSGYRNYYAQTISWQKWLDREPERAAIISVPPGHSEHQLGTTIDFGSPELASLVGIDDIEFHTSFYKTSEGHWLDEYAHEYGFTLSYPLEAKEITGFYYEPWHYRYIGRALAVELKEAGISLTQYLLELYPPPCDP